MKLALVGSLVAASLLVGCNESGMSASKRPDIAPYMGADNGFMAKGWKPVIKQVGLRKSPSGINLNPNTVESNKN